jgi:hypothetical protein
MQKQNYKGVSIQIVSEIADVAIATMYTYPMATFINGELVDVSEPRQLKGTLKQVKHEIARYLKNDWARAQA